METTSDKTLQYRPVKRKISNESFYLEHYNKTHDKFIPKVLAQSIWKHPILELIQSNIFSKIHLPLIAQKPLIKDRYWEFLNPQQSYGVLSACRRAALVNILFNVLEVSLPDAAGLIAPQDLFYLQLVALFAHSIWENKLHDEGILAIKVNCQTFLESIGATHIVARQFAKLLDPEKTPSKEPKQIWLKMILDSADSLNDIRQANCIYYLNNMPLYVELKKINKQNVLENIAKNVLDMMVWQHETMSLNGVCIEGGEGDNLIHERRNVRPKAKKKRAYEYSEHCYELVVEDIKLFTELCRYHKNDSLLTHKVDLVEDLNISQRNELRNSAPSIQIDKDFIFKTLRGDNANYFLQFIDGAISPHIKHPLRFNNKKLYTVDGKGPHLRSEKPPTYTKEQKKDYSKKQSVTYGMPDFQSNPFNFSGETIKTGGVIFFDIENNALLANHLLTRDAGSCARPNDFDFLPEAEQYFKHRANKTLFALDNIAEFKKALKNDKAYKYHNEVFAHLRLTADDRWQLFINADTLETRLLMQIYAKLIYSRLRARGECSADYEVKICYYIPTAPSLHLKQYTKQEQEMDISEAVEIGKKNEKVIEKALDNNFEFLFFLPHQSLIEYLNKNVGDQTLLVKLLCQGYLHILEFFVELKLFDAQTLNQLISTHIKGIQDPKTLIQISYFAMKQDKPFIFQQALQAISGHPEHTKCINDAISVPGLNANLLQMAFSLQKDDYIKELLQVNLIDINNATSEGNTILHYAVSTGKNAYVQWVLNLGADINTLNNQGYSALHLAAADGHHTLVSLILSQPAFKQCDAIIKIKMMEKYFKHLSILEIAAINDQVEVLKILHQDGRFNFNQTCSSGRTLLAIAEDNPLTLAYLLTLPEIDFKKKDPRNYGSGQNALHRAAANGFVEVVKMLLDKGIDVNDTCTHQEKTALHYVVDYADADDVEDLENRVEIIKLLLKAHINKDALSQQGESALLVAVKDNCAPLIKVLVKNGCSSEGFGIHKLNSNLLKYEIKADAEKFNRFFRRDNHERQTNTNDEVESKVSKKTCEPH